MLRSDYAALPLKTLPTEARTTDQTNIPRHEVEALAQCLLPDIRMYFESEQGKREFAEWKKKQAEQKGGSK